MRQVTVWDRLRYAFDNTMSRGAVAMIAWLALVAGGMILGAALLVTGLSITQAGSDNPGLLENLWMSLMRAMDPGTVAGDTGWAFRAVMLLVTIGGIFIVSTLIGILANGLQARLDELRKGRSFVLEEGHTLILGWSPKVFTIISELVVANENQHRPAVVVLADRDKVEMEDEIRSRVPVLKNTRVICRSGNPCDPAELEIANPFQSRSIVVLPQEGNADSQTIKTILAITNSPRRRPEAYHIVAEIQDPRNLEVARMVGKDEVELLLADELIAKMIVQTSRQSGLSVVYTELMDFDGDEIYFNAEPALVGKTFGETLSAYVDSAVMGLQHADGRVVLNPPMDTVIESGDKIIAITEDDDTLVLKNHNVELVGKEAIVGGAETSRQVESILVLGWNRRAPIIIRELDEYVCSGSQLKVVTTIPADIEALRDGLTNLELGYECADTTDRALLERLEVSRFDHILLLCYQDSLDPQEADAQALITLLHLRNLADQMGRPLRIVSEMLDVRNRELAEVTRADDFIVSDRMVSLLMSQISENKHLMRVFDDLFRSEGSEIYLKPASAYVRCGVEVNFYTIIESARAQGQVALGYRLAGYSHDSARAYGVVVNPVKSDRFVLEVEDRVIVLAQD